MRAAQIGHKTLQRTHVALAKSAAADDFHFTVGRVRRHASIVADGTAKAVPYVARGDL